MQRYFNGESIIFSTNGAGIIDNSHKKRNMNFETYLIHYNS
jgi:hypothetical protein